jgi:hypothetical protein
LDGTPCKACGGGEDESAGCQACGGSGDETVRGCPYARISPEVSDLIELVRMSDVALPVAGGIMDQTQSFVQGMRVVRAARAKWEATIGRAGRRR